LLSVEEFSEIVLLSIKIKTGRLYSLSSIYNFDSVDATMVLFLGRAKSQTETARK